MRDVAEEAGVSLKTVSRVVNGESGVTDALTDRVRAAVDALGYQPDDRARFLRRAAPSSKSLGFVQMNVANPFFAAILRGLEDVARARGHLVLAGSSDGQPDREEALIKSFIARRVDGLVIASCHPDLAFLTTEMSHGTPVVFVDLEPATDIGELVHADHRGGAKAATTHLLAGGHRDIAFLGDRAIYWSADQRRLGFVDAMAQAGLPTPWILSELGDPILAYTATRDLLLKTPRPTALFTAQHFVTIGAIRALHELGLQHEVAMVGFDEVELGDVIQPAISVVPQDPSEVGRLAGERIYARLEGAAPLSAPISLSAGVVARGSGEIPPPDSAAAQRGRPSASR
ncbi:MAG: LacI family DNA-binding transcriptional regulator [Actinomycetota bacterium]